MTLVRGSPGHWREVLHPRVRLAACVMVLWGVAIAGRLVHLQVVDHAFYVERAGNQQVRAIETPARRGELLDRRGRVLAHDVAADTVIAEPRRVADAAGTARRLCAVMACAAERERRLASVLGRATAFAYVERQVSPRVAQRIRELDLDGIGFLKENRRYYPNGRLAAHLLGYAGVDNQGLHGLESLYEETLAGEPGSILVQRDAQQQAFRRAERRPTAGVSLELSIDSFIQHVAERELRAAVREHGADGGSVVVLDPRTGDILALANEPTFNPNAWQRVPADARRNRATQDVYEPGSTFKIVTAAAALDERLARPGDVIDTSPGVIYYGGRPIREFRGRNYGALTFAEVIVKSSNVGASQIGVALGSDRLNRYVRRFGFGQTSARDFPGESRGIVRDASRLREGDLARVAMGYTVSVTPLQMAVAMNAVANRGELLAPRLVRATLGGGVREDVPVRVVRRAVTTRTAATVTRIMEDVVARGTARAARIPGYGVAGKTGTAEKLLPGGGYSRNDHVASFAGFVPSTRPRLTVLVAVDGVAGSGGVVAAPVFRRIGEAVLPHLGVAPDVDAPSPLLVPPGSAPFTRARPVLARADAGPDPADAAVGGVMPDLLGLGARAAVAVATDLGLSTRLRGRGVVVRQAPAAGDAVAPGQALVLTLDRRGAGAGS